MKTDWVIRAQSTGSVLDLAIYDVVDPGAFDSEFFGSYGVSAKQLLAQLKAAKDVSLINVRINSAGGDVFDGMAIYSLLKSHPAKVRVQVDGLCASIASIIAMAGDDIVMCPGAWMMIHNPYSASMGGADADDLRATADVLDKMTESMCAVYCERTGLDTAAITKAMAAETWMTAAEAVALGYATQISPANAPESTQPVASKASSLLKNFARVPAGAFMAMARAYEDLTMPVKETDVKPVASDENKELEMVKAELETVKKAKIDVEAALEALKASAEKPEVAAVAAALAKFSATAQALTGTKSVADAEVALVALAAKNDKLERLDAEISVMRKERHQARVSQVIAEGRLNPSRKEYFLSASSEDLDHYLAMTGGEVIVPIAQEHKQPEIKAAVAGKAEITAADRTAGRHLNLTEEQMQAAADLRAARFGK